MTKDQIIDELIEKTQQKKREIEKLDKPKWLTNGVFKKHATDISINIKTVTDVRSLIDMLAYIIGEENNFNAANLILGTDHKFEFLGFPVESWVNDLKTRIDVINIITKRKELEVIEAQLDGLVSAERKEESLLQSIRDSLNK